VGRDQYVLVLTGDHGTPSASEVTEATGMGGGRIDLRQLFSAVDSALVERFGPTEEGFHYLSAVEFPWLYLNTVVLTYHKIDVDAAAEVAVETDRSFEGIEEAYNVQRMAAKAPDALSPLEKAVLDSVYADRSGHVFLHPKRYWQRSGVASAHGSFHNYDTHVPLVFVGPGFTHGTNEQRVDMRDVAPTLSAVLGIAAPAGAEGQVLKEAIGR
jgi:arylsulfatase A-like enzyme